jgi:NAD-dependent deacetylase
MLPQAAINRAILEAQRCDACFSVGTSGMVQPAASLPYLALEAGATVIEVNPEPTPLSVEAHFSLRAKAAVALPAIAAAFAS